MIKRTYFMSVKRDWDDGRGVYSWKSLLISRSSLFSDNKGAFEYMLNSIEWPEQAKGSIQVIAFNRV